MNPNLNTFSDEELSNVRNSVTSEDAFPDDPIAGDLEEAIESHYDRLITEALLEAHELAQQVVNIDAGVVAIVGVNIINSDPVADVPSLQLREIFDAYETTKSLLLSAKAQCIANMYGWRISQ